MIISLRSPTANVIYGKADNFLSPISDGRFCFSAFGHITSKTPDDDDWVSIHIQASPINDEVTDPSPEIVALFHQARHLLAAAPDMLTALEELVAVAEQRGYQPEWLINARAAIAKARGQA